MIAERINAAMQPNALLQGQGPVGWHRPLHQVAKQTACNESVTRLADGGAGALRNQAMREEVHPGGAR